MSQTFDNSEPPRAQRMTAPEARAVIHLWQQERVERGRLTDRPALFDVAEGLDISVEDARRLLDLVRARRVGRQDVSGWYVRRPLVRHRSGTNWKGLAAAVAALTAIGWGLSGLSHVKVHGPAPAAPMRNGHHDR